MYTRKIKEKPCFITKWLLYLHCHKERSIFHG
nr:MAG TPA_asm: hypothetical protein [Caudoviricetes sp.]